MVKLFQISRIHFPKISVSVFQIIGDAEIVLRYFAQLKGFLKIPQKNEREIEKLSENEKVLDEQRKEEEAEFQKLMSSLQKETKSFQEEKDKLQEKQMTLKKKYDEMKSAVRFTVSSNFRTFFETLIIFFIFFLAV